MREEPTGASTPGAAPEQNGTRGARAPARSERTGMRGNGGAPMAPEQSDEFPGLGAAVRWGERAWSEIRCLGKRIFVHMAAFFCGVAAGFSSGSLTAGICVYIGGVCLAARGMGLTPGWLIPAAAGCVQTLLLSLAGLPFPQALFWGGAQAWAQRIVAKRGAMAGEWIMLLFILPTAVHLLNGTPLTLLAGSFAAVAAAGALLTQAVFRRQAAREQAEALRLQGPPEPERLVRHRAALELFSAKAALLPEEPRQVALSIAGITGNILACMAEDKRDIERGHRFLNRYFTAAHTVVDKYLALSREKAVTPDVVEALAKSEEILIRLDEVFGKEYGRLLQNDVTDFSADLAVIDTLLKMDGR